MVNIPDSLRSLFSATVHKREDKYIVELPQDEIENGALAAEETYRVAVFQSPVSSESGGQSIPAQPCSRRNDQPAGPPVDEGEVRDVTIETVGDQGDGIAKVERGYVVIVPEAQPGDEPTIEIEQVRENVAFASVVDPDPRTL